MLIHGVHGSNNELGDAHADSSDKQDCATAPSVEVHDGRDRGEEVDYSDNPRCKEAHGVAGKANVFENRGCIAAKVSTARVGAGDILDDGIYKLARALSSAMILTNAGELLNDLEQTRDD